MKYKGKEIGNPSIRQIKNCLRYLGKPLNKFSPEKIYKELEKRHWRSTSGYPISNLENYIHGICGVKSNKYLSDEYLSKKPKQTKKQNIILDKQECTVGTYNEQLKDPRWKAFRQFVFAVRGCKCEVCGYRENLQVHHPKYIKGRAAWEYTCNEVVVLCDKCHKKVHGLLV
jgi:5-methylcytosine-specific restriction endonuclease McrA